MKKSGFIVIICFLCLFLSSCGKKSETGISLYYINEARTGFVEKKITCKSKTQEAIVKELYDKLRKLSADGTSKAPSDYMVINDVALEGGILYLNFASGYTGLSDKDKALFRTAVSKTMSSLDFVEYVRIYENGSPITDSNGVDIGLLNNQSFITDSNSDDEIDTNYFEQLLIACKNTDIAVCNLIVESNNKEELSRFEMNNQILTSTEALNQLLTRKGINSGPCAKLFRKKIIEDLYFPDLKVYEDILFVKDAFKKAKKVSVINSVAYHYYQNEGSAMHAGENTPSLDIINVTEQLLKFEDKNKQLSPECIYITFSHLYQYVQLLRDNDSEKSRVFIKEAQKIFYKNYKMMINCKFFYQLLFIILIYILMNRIGIIFYIFCLTSKKSHIISNSIFYSTIHTIPFF